MRELSTFWQRDFEGRPTILDALDMWSCWHGECSPLGATGDYTLDMLLADAFRALLYRPGHDAKLDWLRREVIRTERTKVPARYRAELCRWHCEIFEAAKIPVIETRINNRSLVSCVTSTSA